MEIYTHSNPNNILNQRTKPLKIPNPHFCIYHFHKDITTIYSKK